MNNAIEIYDQGYYYYTGTQGYPLNYRLAFQRFTDAAAMMHSPSMNYLGLMYEYGKGVEKDLSRAFHWYQKAADLGDNWGLYNLARQYHDGLSVPQDMDFAMKLYRESYEKGIHQAGFYMGNYLLERGKIREAFQAYKNAAHAGDFPNAWHQLGYMIETYPDLTDLDKKSRMANALQYYKKAAEKGLPIGMFMYGQRLFHLGQHRDGAYWIKKAADTGLPEAQKLARLLRFAGH